MADIIFVISTGSYDYDYCCPSFRFPVPVLAGDCQSLLSRPHFKAVAAWQEAVTTAGTSKATVRPRSITEHRQLFDIPRTRRAALENNLPITAHPRSCIL